LEIFCLFGAEDLHFLENLEVSVQQSLKIPSEIFTIWRKIATSLLHNCKYENW